MGKMDELDAAIGEMTKKLEKIDDKAQVQELRESIKMVKQQAKDDPEKIDELIASMKMMSTSIDDPSAMFAGMGGGGGGGGQTIKVEIVDHFAETNAAIREAKQTNDIDTLERVLKERANYKSPLYFDAEKTLMAWKQKRCKDAMLKAIEEKDVKTLKAELEIAARPDVYMTGTNSKGEPFSDMAVFCAREELDNLNNQNEKWFDMVKSESARPIYVKFWRKLSKPRKPGDAVERLSSSDPIFSNAEATFDFMKMSGAGVAPDFVKSVSFLQKYAEPKFELRQAIVKAGILFYFKSETAKGCIPIHAPAEISSEIVELPEGAGFAFTVKTKLPRRFRSPLGCDWKLGGKTRADAEALLEKLTKLAAGKEGGTVM